MLFLDNNNDTDVVLTLRQGEQAERRRLEEELRNLKKAHGPGKSALSQSAVNTPNER